MGTHAKISSADLCYVLQNNDVKWPNSAFYYIDTGVLLKNTPLVKFIRNYIRDPSNVFSISSLVKISMTSFLAVSRLFVFGWLFVYIIKRTLHVSSKISKLCSRGKNRHVTTYESRKVKRKLDCNPC